MASGLSKIDASASITRRAGLTYRPPHGTKRSALKRRCAPFRKSVPSRTTSPAIGHSKFSPTLRENLKPKLTRQFDVLVLNLDEVPILAELRRVKVAHRDAALSEANKFFAVEACGVSEHTTSVDDRDSLVVRQQDFV